jgi:hypothetical protein
MADADPAMKEEFSAMRSDAATQKARADAAEARLNKIDADARKVRMTAIKVRADAADLTIPGLDKTDPTAEDLVAAERAFVDAFVTIRADALDPYARPNEAPPPRPELGDKTKPLPRPPMN